MSLQRWWLGCVAVIAGCITSSTTAEHSLLLRWVNAVLLGSEVGDARTRVVRWEGPVRYLAVAVPGRMRTAVDDAFAQLKGALQGVHSLQLDHVDVGDERIGQEGFITVFARAPRDAGELAERYDVHRPQARADGWFTIVWNRRFELMRAVVFVDPELDDRWLQHTALEEMFQALGPSNDSSLVRDSLIFESRRLAGSLQKLTRTDEQMLSLLYGELNPGDGRADIDRAMRRAWVFLGG